MLNEERAVSKTFTAVNVLDTARNKRLVSNFFCAITSFMKTKKLIALIALSFVFLASGAALAQAIPTVPDPSVPDFHIDKNGNVNINQAKVMLIAGTSFYLRYYVGLAFIRILITTTSDTKVYRRYGDNIPMSRIVVGDTINFQGTIQSTADTLTVVASSITDFSDQKQVGGFKGMVVGMGNPDGSFLLATSEQGNITVTTGTTTQIRKGTRFLTPDRIRPGDQITDAEGTFDHGSNTLTANIIVIYTDMSVYQPRNFQGTIKTITGAGNGRSIVFTTNGKDYSVVTDASAKILRANWTASSMDRFVAGDTIRIYGAIRETDDPIIDAEIIRDLNL